MCIKFSILMVGCCYQFDNVSLTFSQSLFVLASSVSLSSKLLFNGAKLLTLRTLSLDGNAESKDSEPIKLSRTMQQQLHQQSSQEMTPPKKPSIAQQPQQQTITSTTTGGTASTTSIGQQPVEYSTPTKKQQPQQQPIQQQPQQISQQLPQPALIEDKPKPKPIQQPQQQQQQPPQLDQTPASQIKKATPSFQMPKGRLNTTDKIDF